MPCLDKEPPWRALYDKLAAVDVDSAAPEVISACSEINAWCRSHVPPISVPDHQPNDGLLRRVAEVCKVGLGGPYSIAPLQTTALLLHDAYTSSTSSQPAVLDVKAALSLAQQVTASGLLEVLPLCLEMDASLVEKGFHHPACERQGLSAAEPLALLQLFRAIQQMWPGGVLKSKAAAPAAAPAARMAVALLQCAKPHQQAGVRYDVIWGDSLAMAQQLMQQLQQQAAGSPDGSVDSADPLTQNLLKSPHFLLLVLLVLEVQMQRLLLQQQQQGTSVACSSSSSSSSIGGSSAGGGAGARSSSSRQCSAQQQTYYQPYCDQLLQLVGPTQQLWDATCSTLPFNGPADVLATLQLLLKLLGYWDNIAFYNGCLEEEDRAVLQPLALLPVQLLQLAAASLRHGQQHLSLVATRAASSVTFWHALGCEPAHLQVLPLVVQIMQQVLAMHWSTPAEAEAEEEAGDQAAGSSSSSSSRQDLLMALLSLLPAMAAQRNSEDWGPSAPPLAAALEQLLRLVLTAEPAATDAAATPRAAEFVLSEPHLLILGCCRSTLNFLIGDAYGEGMAPLTRTATLPGREHEQLFGLLVSALKMAAHSSAWQHDMTLFECIHSSVRHVCSSLAPSSSGGALSLDAAGWLALWGRCLIRKAEELEQQLQKRLPDDAAAAKALFWHPLSCAFGHTGLCRHVGKLAAVLDCCLNEFCAASVSSTPATQQQGDSSSSSSSASTSTSSSSASTSNSRWPAVPLAATAAGAAAYWSGFMTLYQQGQLQQQLRQLHLVTLQADQVVTAAAALAEGKAWPEMLARCRKQPGYRGIEVERCFSGSTPEQAVLEDLRTASSPAERVAVLQQSFLAQIPTQLQAVGEALCAQLPLPHCCNWVGCSNMAGASELQLVGGKRCICGGCKVARYCSRTCQTLHWKQHKPVCKRLQEAQAPAPATAVL